MNVSFKSYTTIRHYTVQGSTFNWIRTFLSEHTQRVVVDGARSDVAPVSVSGGVPQGTLLGPFLFLIFINDLPDQLHS